MRTWSAEIPLRVLSYVLLISTSVIGGCSSTTQVQKAARDWCATIRASQVVPVYPLTEDIQPGDIFLVQVPITKQQELYERDGFLPLDNHLDRMNPGGYDQFYGLSFFAAGKTNKLPRDWIRPSDTNQSWQAAPHTTFPSYSFAVRQGAGMNLAVPVQGVPVGLSLMASHAASGTIEIKDAYTMGVDTVSLYRQLQDWAGLNADFLQYFAQGDRLTNYLRVVTRIYATGKMSVNLKDASNRGAGLDVGAAKPVELLVPSLSASGANTTQAALENYTNAWNSLSQIVQAAGAVKDAAGNLLPGGSLRLTAASTRSISIDESFIPPVVFGYLGFDCVIGTNGDLGAPIPTYAVLGGLPVRAQMRHFARDPSSKVLRNWVDNPKPGDIPEGKTAKEITKEREKRISAWIKARKASYSLADLLYDSNLESDRQQFIKDNSISQ